MKIESPEFEHGRVYFKQFGAERVNALLIAHSIVSCILQQYGIYTSIAIGMLNA